MPSPTLRLSQPSSTVDATQRCAVAEPTQQQAPRSIEPPMRAKPLDDTAKSPEESLEATRPLSQTVKQQAAVEQQKQQERERQRVAQQQQQQRDRREQEEQVLRQQQQQQQAEAQKRQAAHQAQLMLEQSRRKQQVSLPCIFLLLQATGSLSITVCVLQIFTETMWALTVAPDAM